MERIARRRRKLEQEVAVGGIDDAVSAQRVAAAGGERNLGNGAAARTASMAAAR